MGHDDPYHHHPCPQTPPTSNAPEAAPFHLQRSPPSPSPRRLLLDPQLAPKALPLTLPGGWGSSPGSRDPTPPLMSHSPPRAEAAVASLLSADRDFVGCGHAGPHRGPVGGRGS